MMRRGEPSRCTAASRGFTLVEMLAAVIVIAIIGVLASSLILRVATANTDTTTRGLMQSDLSTAMERVDRMLREIDNRSGATTPYIDSVTATSISFNGTSSISLSGTNLQLVDSGAAAATLLTNVSSLAIQTYDESNTALAASLSGSGCDAIRRISVTITVTRSGLTDTLRTKVFLRSTMSGAAPGS